MVAKWTSQRNSTTQIKAHLPGFHRLQVHCTMYNFTSQSKLIINQWDQGLKWEKEVIFIRNKCNFSYLLMTLWFIKILLVDTMREILATRRVWEVHRNRTPGINLLSVAPSRHRSQTAIVQYHHVANAADIVPPPTRLMLYTPHTHTCQRCVTSWNNTTATSRLAVS